MTKKEKWAEIDRRIAIRIVGQPGWKGPYLDEVIADLREGSIPRETLVEALRQAMLDIDAVIIQRDRAIQAIGQLNDDIRQMHTESLKTLREVNRWTPKTVILTSSASH